MQKLLSALNHGFMKIFCSRSFFQPSAGEQLLLFYRWHVLHTCKLQQVQSSTESSRFSIVEFLDKLNSYFRLDILETLASLILLLLNAIIYDKWYQY